MNKKINSFYLILYLIIQYSVFQFAGYYNDKYYEKPIERYLTIVDPIISKSSIERIDIIQQGFGIIDRNPIVGVGLDNSSYYTGIFVHNPIILAWVENGIFGMIGFSSIYLVLLFIGIKCFNNKFYNDHLLMCYVVVMAMMIFGDMFMANSYKRILWLPALMMIVNYDRVKDQVK